MINASEALQIVQKNTRRTLESILETPNNYYFSYGSGEHDGFYAVRKTDGHFSFFMPHYDLDEYLAMTLVKRL